ncbi:protein FAM227A-like isoform X2 [Amphiura filiformis]|uniref:protein FAM227A-like isoform X2 n=1 Tax=Amphiura filiformis TaxID=82378 RepID=UPI003B21128E
MADINRTNSPMNFYREDCLETKEELDEARERLIKEQSTKPPFLVGSIDRVNDRIANLDKELDSFSTSLVIDSRNSNIEDEYAYLTPQYQQQPQKAKDSKERTQFAGIYAVKSTLLADSNLTKTKHLTTTESKKKAAKEKPTTKPKLVELHQYPGYDAAKLTPLPVADTMVILRTVTEAQDGLSRKTHYKIEFKRLFTSKMSEAVVADTFWWFFLQRYHPSKIVQEKIFNRVAHNYVKLTLFAKHPKYRDVFLKSFPDLLAQSIYCAFCAAFPNSWRQFDDKFKSDLCTLTHQWIVGTRPMPNLWENWNMTILEPKDMRKEVLMKKDSKKKGLLNLDFTQEPGSTSTSQIGINLKGGPLSKNKSRTNSIASASSTSLGITPLDSDINSIAAVAQAQGSSGAPSKTKGPLGAGKASNLKASNLHPINEVMSESSYTANDLSSTSEDSKTLPVKKLEKTQKKDGKAVGMKSEKDSNGVTIKSRNVSNMSVAKSSSLIGSKVNGRKKVESHPACSGPDFTKVAFNAYGRSPLVQHFLTQKGLEKTAGMDVFYQRTEIDKLPPLDAKTYREIIQETFSSVRHLDENYKEMHEEGIKDHTQFLMNQRQRLKEHMRRENALMAQPREVKRLSDLLVLELLKDHDEVSTGAALAVEEALLQQDQT